MGKVVEEFLRHVPPGWGTAVAMYKPFPFSEISGKDKLELEMLVDRALKEINDMALLFNAAKQNKQTKEKREAEARAEIEKEEEEEDQQQQNTKH